MRHPFTTLFCSMLLGLTEVVSAAQAEDSSSTAPAFYSWLEKYQNPAVEHPIHNAQVNGSQPAPSMNEPAPAKAMMTLPSARSSVSETVTDEHGEQVVGPGEGLGCYYHRSYYSHLPLFTNNGNYSLRGDIDVAEPYHQSSEHVSAASHYKAR